MEKSSKNPLIVQPDKTVFLEVEHPLFKEVRDKLARFAELEKSPRYVHVYRITPLSLWNAAASGLAVADVNDLLTTYSKYPVPRNVRDEVSLSMARYGQVRLVSCQGKLCLETTLEDALQRIRRAKSLRQFFSDQALELLDAKRSSPLTADASVVLPLKPESRGQIKVALLKLGFPVHDQAGYVDGAPLAMNLRDVARGGKPFHLRSYQRDAVEAFYDFGRATGGSGVVVLPCGAGKTIVAIGCLQRVGSQALILTTNTTALRQWKRELLDKTDLEEDMIGEYSGEVKEIRPITLSTYQMMTYRDRRTKELLHYKLFTARNWGLIVYDEAHLLPAPVFRFTAQIQATRRLGLTATLVREDGREGEVFSLVGPKKYDIAWKSLEAEGWIANAECVEIRVPLTDKIADGFVDLNGREKFRAASENPAKIDVVRELLGEHREHSVLVLGQYLDHLKAIQRHLGAPLITGKTSNQEREQLYARFRRREVPVLIVSKVGNFAIDLPDANVAIQVSGTFGSRQEEAQRLGRILRPKGKGGRAVFYSLVSRDTPEQEFAEKRQRFLTEQGYSFTIIDQGTRRRQDSA